MVQLYPYVKVNYESILPHTKVSGPKSASKPPLSLSLLELTWMDQIEVTTKLEEERHSACVFFLHI